jgi:Cu/Ag efflux pump CusA
VADLDGEGDAVGGIVIMRQGENALNVINRVKAKIEEIKPSLPKGVEIVTTYDRSDLIKRAIDTLKHQLIEEVSLSGDTDILVAFPSAIIPIVTIPIAASCYTDVRPQAYPIMSSGSHIDRSTGGWAIVEVENAKETAIVGGREARRLSPDSSGT